MTVPNTQCSAALDAKEAVLPDWEAFEERVAIMEYDGGLPREEAERQAWECVLDQPAERG